MLRRFLVGCCYCIGGLFCGFCGICLVASCLKWLLCYKFVNSVDLVIVLGLLCARFLLLV